MTASTATTRRSSTRNSGSVRDNIDSISVSDSMSTKTTGAAAKPLDFSPPSKGFFTTTASSRGTAKSPYSTSNPRSNSRSNQANDDSGLAKSPSSVGPMRRKVSESASTGRNLPTSNFNSSIGAKDSPSSTSARPIPGAGAGASRTRSPSTSLNSNSRSSSRSFGGMGGFASRGIGNNTNDDSLSGDLSTSFGAAAEALSLSSSIPTGVSAPTNGNQISFSNLSSNPLLSSSMKNLATKSSKKSSMGHSHFGQECYGPGVGDLKNPPPNSMLSSSANDNGSKSSDAKKEVDGESKSQGIHRCESCSKVYRHPSCLVKHRWEHTVYWKEASKFLMSKHQQVQLLEAAAILVGMDSSSGSLPEEKALWPAAISPPSSGLLGSDQINYEKLRSMPRQTTEAERNDRAFSPMTNDGNGTERSMSVVTDSFEEDEELENDGRQRHYVDEEDEMENNENEDDDDDDEEEDDEENQSFSSSFNQRSKGRSINYNSSNSRNSINSNKLSSSGPRSLTLSPINRMSDLRIATSPTNKSHFPRNGNGDREQSKRPNHRQHYQSYSSTTIPTLSSSSSSTRNHIHRNQSYTNGGATSHGHANVPEERQSRNKRNTSVGDLDSEETSSNTTSTDLTDSPPDTTQDQSFDEMDEEEKAKLKYEKLERESAGEVLAEMDMD